MKLISTVLSILYLTACSSNLMSEKAVALEKEIDNEISRLQQEARDSAAYQMAFDKALNLHLTIQSLLAHVSIYNASEKLQLQMDSVFALYQTQAENQDLKLWRIQDCDDKTRAIENSLENELLILKSMR